MTAQIARLHVAVLTGIASLFSTAFADTALAQDGTQNQAFTLTWSAPTSNEDGTPLTDLLGYYIYVGNAPDALLPLYYTNAGNSSVVLGVGGPGLRYFAVSAVNYDGVESDLTAVLSEPVPDPEQPPVTAP